MIPNGAKVMVNSFEIGDGLQGRPDDGLVYAPSIGTEGFLQQIITLNPGTGEIRHVAPIGPWSFGTAFIASR